MARILIANDNPDLVSLCQSLLEDAGHSVRTVLEGGFQAVAVARSWQPDLVLVDWVMPEMDGATAIKTLRAHTSTSHIRIILMSGSEGAAQIAKHSGADR